MDLISISGLGLALAMDAFAVSLSSGCTLKKVYFHHAFRIAFFFGLFQAVMPVLGWYAGLSVRSLIASVDHWIAFGLLSLIGGKMIYEAFYLKDMEKKCDPTGIMVLLGLAVATSIDALAVGISFSLLEINILLPVLIIGGITFILSFGGVFIGNRFGNLMGNKFEIIGGILLLVMGFKILLSHLLSG
ncbi:MAG: manganese efflux pump [Candidatus Cloacimonetes bacterium]|nr:manganese efflux pump [Candidatus Cloacimonadota bacterium]